MQRAKWLRQRDRHLLDEGEHLQVSLYFSRMSPTTTAALCRRCLYTCAPDYTIANASSSGAASVVIKARHERAAAVVGRYCRARVRASSRASTGVRPIFGECDGSRTEPACSSARPGRERAKPLWPPGTRSTGRSRLYPR